MITAAYDYLGRRAWKKVETIATDPATGEETVTVTLHQRYIYRGYLQVAACDLTRGGHPCLWLITWDPTQSIATRPLGIQKDGTWYCYGWDLTKNICEVFGQAGYIRTTYSYTPYGSMTEEGDVTQPIQWSSEYSDPELGLVYYNYRYYNPTDGRWNRRERLGEQNCMNLYIFCSNFVLNCSDMLGLNEITLDYIFLDNGWDVTTLTTRVTRIDVDHVKVARRSFGFQPNNVCSSKDCIKRLIIFAHGKYENKMATIYLNNDGYTDDMIENEAFSSFSNFINEENIQFCKDAILDLRICNIGRSNLIKQRIESYYKEKGINLEVKAYPYSIFPSGYPNLFGVFEIIFD